MSACDACLRRSALLGALAPWIARALDEHRRLPAVLALPDDELIESVCAARRARVDAAMGDFRAVRARAEATHAGLATVCPHRGAYPPRLREARDAPAALYLRGRAELLETVAVERPVAVVGSRRASPYGLEVARMLGRELAASGVPVVSGMAFGVDAAAHEGALAARGPTVAVMPSGANVAYPRSKHGLHRRLAEHALVVSEMPPGASPFRWSFPARNRIMAGLASMTVVVEGTTASGSLITARFAQQLGRDVGAVPGEITSGLAAGPNALIADGACVVRSAGDVLDALYGPGRGPPGPYDPRTGKGSACPIEPRLQRLLEAVEAGRGVEALVRAGDPVSDVLAGLTELELLGLVRRGPGGSYIRMAPGATYA
jgi:DNA processing protein